MDPNKNIIFAVDEHDRDDLPWPVPADHWFWQSGDRWVAVVADFHDDWWEGADPADIAARPDPWRIPITERPTNGTLVYLTSDGSDVTEDALPNDPDSGLPNWLHVEIQEALGGDSNDAEHDALVSVADHFGVEYTSFEDREDTIPGESPDPGWMNP